jgi:hypothetical protein
MTKLGAILSSQDVTGTYTPTLTNTTNVAASTAFQCQYIRLGDMVIVSGRVDVDPTSASAVTLLGISLPVASNIGAVEDLAGVAFNTAIAGLGGAIHGDVTNDMASLDYVPSNAANQPMYLMFMYQII